MTPSVEHADIAIIGLGAAGLTTAIFAARRHAGLKIVGLDGAKKLGAKILVAGGGRCNVTNRLITPDDYRGASRNLISRVLDALPVPATVEFFREIGVDLHEEEHGKLFPNSNTARTVLTALLSETQRLGVETRVGWRVTGLRRDPGYFVIESTSGTLTASAVVLATGGLSLPKSGSDGAGYGFARALGHSVTPCVPALVPLLLDSGPHDELSGVAAEALLTLHAAKRPARVNGALLWTHFGVSGPAALDISGPWLRARLDGLAPRLTANFLPQFDSHRADAWLIQQSAERPRQTIAAVLASFVPNRMAEVLLREARVEPATPLAHLPREARRKVLSAFVERALPVRDSRGYTYAEVTSGGVPLTEVFADSMQSRRAAGLFLVGEILDVDGRIGGFNFQWAWSSACVAGAGVVRFLTGQASRERTPRPPAVQMPQAGDRGRHG